MNISTEPCTGKTNYTVKKEFHGNTFKVEVM